jgi:hypothetical protein
MGIRRGLLAYISALAFVPVVAAGCGPGCSHPTDVKWSGKVVLSADSPAAARVIKVDIPHVDRQIEARLDFSWIEEGGNRFERPWVSIVDVTGGTAPLVIPGPGYGEGHTWPGEACWKGCNRSYALVFRWGFPVAGETRAIDVDATLDIITAGAPDECVKDAGTIEATLTEDVSQRFDGKPRMVSARAVGDLKVPLDPATAGGLAYLHAPKALVAEPAVYPAVARVFAGFTPDYPLSTVVTVGSTPQLRDGQTPAQTEWESLCSAGADCTLPIEVSGSFGPGSAPTGATGATAIRRVQWWVEARIELFSSTGSLPDGALTLTQP